MFNTAYQSREICCFSSIKNMLINKYIAPCEMKSFQFRFHHARSVSLQACLRSQVSSVNLRGDFFDRLVSVETGVTESMREISTELTSLANFPQVLSVLQKEPRPLAICQKCQADMMRSRNICVTSTRPG